MRIEKKFLGQNIYKLTRELHGITCFQNNFETMTNDLNEMKRKSTGSIPGALTQS